MGVFEKTFHSQGTQSLRFHLMTLRNLYSQVSHVNIVLFIFP